jgi:type I restriction enzyme S subunit
VKNLKEQGEDKPFAYVKMNNITTANRFDGSLIARVSATAKEIEAFTLKQNDFLFNTRNSRELVGKSCIYEADDEKPTLFNNNITRMQFRDVLDARFCAYAFQIEPTKRQLEAIKSGTTNVAAIYWNKLKDLTIRYPAVDAQRDIVGELHSLAVGVEKLQNGYENKISQLSKLKQSILKKAFSGELTSPPSRAIQEAAE